MIEGILSIQAGDNPRLLEEKLHAFLDPSERETEVEEGGTVQGEAGYSASSAYWNAHVTTWHSDQRRPRAPSAAARSPRKAGDGRHDALAADLRRHDHADAGAVHHPVLDLDDQQGEVQRLCAISAAASTVWTRSTTRPTAMTTASNLRANSAWHSEELEKYVKENHLEQQVQVHTRSARIGHDAAQR